MMTLKLSLVFQDIKMLKLFVIKLYKYILNYINYIL